MCRRLSVGRVSAFHLFDASPYHRMRQVCASPHSNGPASSTSARSLLLLPCKTQTCNTRPEFALFLLHIRIHLERLYST
jgi:hypothetical protein